MTISKKNAFARIKPMQMLKKGTCLFNIFLTETISAQKE